MTIASTELRITADGWPGIFLSEEEAALALAGQCMPERVLKDPRVSEDIRQRAAENAEFKQEILTGRLAQMHIARWTDGEIDYSVKVDVHQVRSHTIAEGSKIAGFKTFVSGRGYNMADTSLLIDALQLAYRLASAARQHIENAKTSKTTTAERM